MSKPNWESYEKWLSYLHYNEISLNSHEASLNTPEVKQLLAKKEKLEHQKLKFQSACEQTIINEYVNLKKAHREFMKSIHEAQVLFLDNKSNSVM